MTASAVLPALTGPRYPHHVRRFRQGNPLSLMSALSRIQAGQYLFWNNRPYHPGFLLSWPLRQFVNAVFYEAIENPDWKPREKKEELK